MELYDTLQICLLALVSRYPEHVVDINESVIGQQELGAGGWLAFDMIEYLATTHPALLGATAHMIVNPQKSEIYLLDYAEEQPAFIVHCRGKIPCCQGNVETRRITGALLAGRASA
ncbi:hypothetical protein KSF_079770 [Reticulibacter mediterranei]|uniref:Uncharacterized protein n=1 Tax=Reticulibacter mediterranei TaxID=2778369 RepID=A0A8J3N4E3_9CHLR|nr:hypothetical protein [Reticulibacter mediterranei]GHO97929.1 hypothetical protein KSF_079770 [Reticulibacter mediterranei]